MPSLKEVAEDSKCMGLITWPKISHSDTYLLGYLADNRWKLERLEIEKSTEHYCNTRYPPEIASTMIPVWSSFLILSQSLHWGFDGIIFDEPQFRTLTSNSFIDLSPETVTKLNNDLQRIFPRLKKAPEVLKGLAGMADKSDDNLLCRRDALDMARTIARRAYFTTLALWRQPKADPKNIQQLAKLSHEFLAAMSDVLAMSDDFSMYTSLS